MNQRLFIIEGLPCSGKSTTSAFVSEELGKKFNVCYVDEGTGTHPADYEFHSFLTEDDLHSFSDDEKKIILSVSEKVRNGIVLSLSDLEGELFEKLLQYKIYDFLPWDTEYPVMLEKWRSFADSADENVKYVFNCVLLQNPMCETMMRFGFSKDESKAYIKRIAEIIRPMEPVVIYLKNDDIKSSVLKASGEREGWLDGVIDYHINGAYGKSINAQGLDGYIACLEERQKRELEILAELGIESMVIDNPHKNWEKAYEKIRSFLI